MAFGGAVKLTGESEYKKALSNISQGLKEVSAQMKLTSATYDKNDKSAAALTAKSKDLARQMDLQKQKIDTLRAQYAAMSEQYAKNAQKNEELKRTYDAEKAKLDEIGRTLGTTSKEYLQQKDVVAQLAQEVKKSEAAQTANEKSMSKMRVEILNAEADVKKTEKAIDGLNKEFNETDGEVNGAAKSLKDAEKGLKNVGDEAEKSGKKLEAFRKIGTGLKAVGVAIAAVGTVAVASGKKIYGMAKDTADAGDEIDKMSQKLGLSTTAYQEWDYVLGMSGVEINSMQIGMKTLTNQIDAAKKGGEDATNRFKALGISLNDLKNDSREEIFAKVIKGFQGMEDSTERAALANKIFGRSGQELTPLFNESIEDTEKLKQAAQDLGFVMSEDAVNASAAFKDSLDTLSRTFAGVKNNLLGELLPGITGITDGLSLLFSGTEGGAEKIAEGTKDLTDALGGIITKAADTFSQLFPSLLEAGGGIAKALVGLIGKAANALLKEAPKILKVGVSLAIELIKGLTSELPSAAKELTKVLSSDIIPALLDAVPMVLDAAFQLVEAILDAFSDATTIANIVNAVLDLIPKLVETLKSGLPLIISAATQLLSGIIQALPLVLENLLSELPTFIVQMIDFFLEYRIEMLRMAVTVFMELVKAIPIVVKELISALPQILTTLKTELIDKATEKLSKLWEDIKNIFAPVGDFFKEKWDAIRNVFANVGIWFSEKFTDAWNKIKNVFSGVAEFFGGIWGKIKDKFTQLGTKIGNAISGAVKSGINGIISQIERIINGGINLINGAINLINKIPGVNIGKLGNLSLPRLAKGAVVDRPTLAEIGENGAEAIVPLENNTKWIKKVAAELRLNTASLAREQPNAETQFNSMLNAFKQALSEMKIELDDETAGKFVERTVSRVIYS